MTNHDAKVAIKPCSALLVTLLTVAASACSGASPPSTASAVPNSRAPGIRAVRYVGRFDWSEPAGPRYAWSGATMRVRFRGTAISFRVRASPQPSPAEGAPVTERESPYTVVVDGAKRTLSVGPANERYELARELDPRRVHEVSVVREAEAMAGVHQFLGFEVNGELEEPPPPRRHAIELIGDSITCGYGLLGADKTCHFSYATESSSLAYGSLAAESVDADVTTLCWSGFGVIRNYDGTTSPTMPELFERTLPKETGLATPGVRVPDVVIVALGNNDFDESTKTPLDLATFESRYLALVARIREVYPKAWILVAESPLLGPERMPSSGGLMRDALRGVLLRVVAARRNANDARVELLELPPDDERGGCDEHPNAKMHRILGDRLAAVLRPKLVRSTP